ncbi:hypothetical protein OG394_24890 [Kribbella sp. NBC_01245]|uniref:hypothetical protein n=1 Tax=Kribbella sp. NBC_01245 TaxID=2903578 RepID=UPI002E28B488|nr:hypothetical protein [Kribbella sp. NBC_01245]
MTLQWRKRISALGAALAMTVLMVGAVPAQAGTAPRTQSAWWPFTVPAPTSVTYSQRTESCEAGEFCAYLRHADGYLNFKFVFYDTYRLYDWIGTGTIMEAQTGVASTRLLDASGRVLHCWNAGTFPGTEIDFTPVEYIKLTPTYC